jgi:predicted dehydrogenase/threonine dehydrogenase-like Zn-dependent dehydrogenase
MKQLLQNLRDGTTEIAEVPLPNPAVGCLLIRSSRSLISIGTERMLVDFGKANWIEKARQQPDKVRMVLEKVQTDGLITTVDAVRSKLDQPATIGYCNAGTVIAIGSGVSGFSVGDRVASNGKHAEVVCVPENLCAKVPDCVSDEEASFTVLASIALQGIRLVQPTIGETVVVTGLGLIGLITVQLLRANGCNVLGIDFDENKCELARSFGAVTANPMIGDDPIMLARRTTNGRGADAVLITASTKSNEPVKQAASMCRKRGRIVLVGVVGLELSRADFFEKELTFQVSCSYGPGRYDPKYEEKGHDYPIGFVRWTEQRNFEAVLDLLARNSLKVRPLITHRFPFEEALSAYAVMSAKSHALGMVLEYSPMDVSMSKSIPLEQSPRTSKSRPGTNVVVSCIGAGNYSSRVLLGAFRKTPARLRMLASAGGISSVHHGKKNGFEIATTDTDSIFADIETNSVVVATRHDTHAKYALAAIQSGKHVFVEKPLCLSLTELEDLEKSVQNDYSQLLMVGFNRRFAPHITKIKSLLPTSSPKHFSMTVNAGAIPPEHWTQDSYVGGGRIVGEACHFIDLLRFLAASPIVSSAITELGNPSDSKSMADTATISLKFMDGSVGVINYLANGDKQVPKERLEVFCEGRVLQLDNFRKLTGFGWKTFSKMNLWQQDKGQNACVASFVEAIALGQPSPIPLNEIFEVMRVTLELSSPSKVIAK